MKPLYFAFVTLLGAGCSSANSTASIQPPETIEGQVSCHHIGGGGDIMKSTPDVTLIRVDDSHTILQIGPRETPIVMHLLGPHFCFVLEQPVG